MIPERYGARRIRARYARALQSIPLPVRAGRSDPVLLIDPAGLPVLATEAVDERRVRFSLVVGQARLRLTFGDVDPDLVGHVVDLDSPCPRLVVSTPLHTEWALANAEALTASARRVWAEAWRSCDR